MLLGAARFGAMPFATRKSIMPCMLPRFDANEPAPQAARLRPTLHALAADGIHIGTSSWKYESWLGSIYSANRYQTAGKFSLRKFDADCLREYAETFTTVGGDFRYYRFPRPHSWSKLFTGLPADFTIGLKVPEDITVLRWPKHIRYRKRAGAENEHFLDANLFTRAFVDALAPHRPHVAVMRFEFGRFAKSDFPTAADFLNRLDRFLGALPAGWPYAVEIRNHDYLGPDYFGVLARHGVAHVFNAWTRMPTLAEQIEMPEAFTADFTVVRARLRKGRGNEQAVSKFAPFRETREPDEGTRGALKEIVKRSKASRRRAYIYVNNRLEGNAPSTIEAITSAE